MPAKRPTCVHCGKSYGRRQVQHVNVRWDTPTTNTVMKTSKGMETVHTLPGGKYEPPPRYDGNGIVLKETNAYLSAGDNRMIMTRYVWDGVSFATPYDPFCTLGCALAYARWARNKLMGRVTLEREK